MSLGFDPFLIVDLPKPFETISGILFHQYTQEKSQHLSLEDKMTDKLENIEIGALRVLFGAGAVQRQLLAGMEIGTPSLSSLLYMYKCRVKDHQSLVQKVLQKQKKN